MRKFGCLKFVFRGIVELREAGFATFCLGTRANAVDDGRGGLRTEFVQAVCGRMELDSRRMYYPLETLWHYVTGSTVLAPPLTKLCQDLGLPYDKGLHLLRAGEAFTGHDVVIRKFLLKACAIEKERC